MVMEHFNFPGRRVSLSSSELFPTGSLTFAPIAEGYFIFQSAFLPRKTVLPSIEALKAWSGRLSQCLHFEFLGLVSSHCLPIEHSTVQRAKTSLAMLLELKDDRALDKCS